MKRNTFTLIIADKGTKDFGTFDELYAYFDYEVSINDLDRCRVKLNGHLLPGSPTDIANNGSYKTSFWLLKEYGEY